MTSQYEDMTVRPEDWAASLADFLGIGSPQPGSSDAKLASWFRDLAKQQRNVTANEDSHTAYFLPGAHLRLLSNSTLSWLY